MDTDILLKSAETILQPWTIEEKRPEGNRLDIFVSAANLPAAVQSLVDAHWGHLSAITGLDRAAPAPIQPAAKPGQPAVEAPLAQATTAEIAAPEGYLEVLYHFCQGPAVLTVRVVVPYSQAVIPSICKAAPAASLYERELMEMFGIQVQDTPVTQKLLLPDDWPEGVYPLRKSFTGFSDKSEA
ncbi:MAG: NADH-quinone oxidoreductase subunit C [Anaerolineaceae bacterium]|nr:NADH-quinone oxidoreductase subunit C [Anaerolineaceae bacterium]